MRIPRRQPFKHRKLNVRMSSKMSSGWILAALLASGGSSLAMASEAEPETRKQAEIDYGNPPPPQRENAKVGDIGKSQLSCYEIVISGERARADTTFDWAYRFQKDSDGDGSKDAEPAWVITSMGFANINRDLNAAC